MIRSLLLRTAMFVALALPTTTFALVQRDPGDLGGEVIVVLSAANYNAFQADMRGELGISSGNVATIYYDGDAEPTTRIEIIRNDGSSWWEVRTRELAGWLRTWGFANGAETGLVIVVKYSTGRLG